MKLSDEKLRQLAEAEGKAVLAWQEHGQLQLDFDARQCLTDQTSDGSVQSRVYVGIDGYMLPMDFDELSRVVTDAEMGRRFEKARTRRGKQRRKRGVRRGKLVRRHGADQRYKEIKLDFGELSRAVTMYDQSKDRRLVRATRLGVKQAGRMLRQMSGDVRLKLAEQIIALTDGAEWIRRLIEANLPDRTTVILDFYHAAQHIHQARRTVFGEHEAEGNDWSNQLLGHLLNGTFEQAWELMTTTRSTRRSQPKRQAMDELMRYLLERKQKVAYAGFRQARLDIGSGPTESMCKSLSRRMKGIGMRWSPRNAESMVALEALHQSNLWPKYWSTTLAA